LVPDTKRDSRIRPEWGQTHFPAGFFQPLEKLAEKFAAPFGSLLFEIQKELSEYLRSKPWKTLALTPVSMVKSFRCLEKR